MPFKKLKTFEVCAVTGAFGTFVGPILAEVIGQ